MWTFDYYTAELVAAATTLDRMMSTTEVTVQQVWALVERFPAARRPAVYSFLTGLMSTTTLQIYSMQIKAEQEKRHFEASQAQVQLERANGKERELRTFWVGVGLLLLPIVISVLIPAMSDVSARSIRVCSAAGLGLLIAYVPGFFSLSSSVDTNPVKFAFRTAGAMAGLAMVYFFDPGAMSEILRNLFRKH